VYVPNGWKKIVEESYPKKPFDVFTMNLSLFKDFAGIVKQHRGKKIWTNVQCLLVSNMDEFWPNFGHFRNSLTPSK